MDIRNIVAVVGGIAAIVFGYLAFLRGKKHDDNAEASSDAMIMAEIGYIKANTDEIKSEQKEMRKDYVDIVTRLSANERDIENAVRRIERLEGEK